MASLLEREVHPLPVNQDPTILAPLSTVDWRFLLPNSKKAPFERMVLLGGSVEQAAVLQALGVSQQVVLDFPDQEPVDAVIVRAGHERLDVRSLRPRVESGTVLYAEMSTYRKPFIPAARLRSLLHRNGWGGVRMYGIGPNPRQPYLYAPLNAGSSLYWYLKTLYDPPSMVRDVVRRVAILGGVRGTEALMSILPWYCITAVFGTHGTGTPEVLMGVEDELPSPASEMFPLMLCDTGNRVVMLPFSKESTQPEVVLKIPKVASVNDRTQNEHVLLQEVRRACAHDLQQSVPEPRALVWQKDIVVGVEKYLAGEALTRHTTSVWRSRGSKLRDLEAAARWLARFHLHTESERCVWNETLTQRWVVEPIEAYRAHFGGVDAERRLFEQAIDYARALSNLELPIVWQHRDFNIWNVFKDDGDIRVLDWEGLRKGPALCDLLHFSTHWHEAVVGASSEDDRTAAFRILWLNERTGSLQRSAHEVIALYLRALNIDDRLLPLLLLYTWVELALRRADQQRDQGVTVRDPRKGNRMLLYLRTLAGGADMLFEPPAALPNDSN